MNGSMKQFVAVAAFAALSAACGGTGASSQDEASTTPAPDATATAAPTATPKPLPAGIYVSGNGSDSAAGTGLDPFRTIQHGLEVARNRSLHDVYVIGGGANGIFDEVVTLHADMRLQGSVCPPAVLDTALRIDPIGCVTAIVGGSPALIASNVHDVEIADFQIHGAKPEGASWYAVAGCVGHGNNVNGSACDAPTDDDGRALPAPALGAAIFDSQNVTFTRTTIASADGANGLRGIDGDDGLDAAGAAATMGGAAGAKPETSGFGGSGAMSPCGDPDANGGMGGRGGRWYTTGLTKDAPNFNLVFTGDAGSWANGTSGSDTAPLNIWHQAGANGPDGKNGNSGTRGQSGVFGSTWGADALSLLSIPGARGHDGSAGRGGAGGAGGAPASREMFIAFGNEWYWESSAGTNAMTTNANYPAVHGMGETAGGAGGGGGAAGCGGHGGHGGQSGAKSVALVAYNSTIVLLQSSVVSGNGGNGAFGGNGGFGGRGTSGAEGGAGATTSAQLAGTYDAYGQFILSNYSTPLSNGSVIYSGSRGGKGGRGGYGGNGGDGGNGGAGAGGSSIGITAKSSDVTLISSTITVGTPGLGANGAENGAAKDQFILP